MAVEFRPLQGSFGADVLGVPPSLEVDADVMQAIESAWYRYSILRFRDLDLTPEQHIAFTQRLGLLHVMEPLSMNLPGHPEIFVVSNALRNGKPIGLKRAGEGFHTDGEDKAIPNAGSLLYALQVPPERGDTLFADMYSVYEALPIDVRKTLQGRRARFSRNELHHTHYPNLPALSAQEKQARPDVYHPLLRKHPKSGRTALYVGRWAIDIEGLPPAEGRELIRYLQAFAQQPRFVYRQRWRVGDAILWDNRCTQHCATGFDDERYVRLMHRTTLEGDVPLMAG